MADRVVKVGSNNIDDRIAKVRSTDIQVDPTWDRAEVAEHLKEPIREAIAAQILPSHDVQSMGYDDTEVGRKFAQVHQAAIDALALSKVDAKRKWNPLRVETDGSQLTIRCRDHHPHTSGPKDRDFGIAFDASTDDVTITIQDGWGIGVKPDPRVSHVTFTTTPALANAVFDALDLGITRADNLLDDLGQVTKLDDGALQSEYIVGYNGMSDAIYASKHDHAQFVTECADGNINYEFDVFNTLSHEPATTLNEGLTNALRVLKPKIYDNHRWAMLPGYLPEFAEFNPVYDTPHALDVLDKNKCDVVVKADVWEGELRSAHARYVWGDSDKYKDARATFNLQEFEKPLEESWRFEGSCHENGVHAYHKCEGTFEDVLSGFDAFKTDFSTKVNDV